VPDRGGKGKLELLVQTFKGVAARAFAAADRIRPRLREGRILQANAVASSFRRPGRSGGRARRGDDVSRDHPWAVDRCGSAAAEASDVCHLPDLFRTAVPPTS
jgi:hypothetical protein